MVVYEIPILFTKENKKMKEIKLTIDGEEVQLTDEQWRFLRTIEKEKHPFERAYYGCYYFCISSLGSIESYGDFRDREADAFFKEVNYFSTRPFANQVALHQLLYRKLLKFSYENKCADVEWNGRNDHWCIYYNPDDFKYCVAGFASHKFDSVWFSSEDAAERAIEEVVKPFVKEHPEFVW